MSKDTELHHDDRTVLVDHDGRHPASSPLTNSTTPPRIEQLQDRMIYAAAQRPVETYNIGFNSLVTAASRLLSQVARLKSGEVCEDLQSLGVRLCDELDSFVKVALHDGIENGQVSSARYVLCTVIDEAVVTTPWGKESQWSQTSLLSRFHKETSGGEKFFLLLERLSKDPAKNLPMLELMYLCLSLGFEGKYRVQPRGTLELQQVSDALYRQIRHLRGDVSLQLSPKWEGLKEERRSLVRIVPWWWVALFTTVCLVVMYSSFDRVLGEQRDSVLQPFLPLDPAPVSPLAQRSNRDA